MVIGILQVELFIGDAASLKDKRRVLLSVKDRLGRDNALAVAEVGNNDLHQSATLGIATVSNSAQHAQSVLDRALETLRRQRQLVISSHQIEIMTGQ